MGMEMGSGGRKEGRKEGRRGIEELKWHTYFGDPHDLNADGHLQLQSVAPHD